MTPDALTTLITDLVVLVFATMTPLLLWMVFRGFTDAS